MRDPARYDTIWNMVRKTLNTTDYVVKWADVFPGRYEAEFSWIAANVLSKGFVRYPIQLKIYKHKHTACFQLIFEIYTKRYTIKFI